VLKWSPRGKADSVPENESLAKDVVAGQLFLAPGNFRKNSSTHSAAERELRMQQNSLLQSLLVLAAQHHR
jgi:hypothetical protein